MLLSVCVYDLCSIVAMSAECVINHHYNDPKTINMFNILTNCVLYILISPFSFIHKIKHN